MLAYRTIALLLLFAYSAYGKCICSVTKNGEYCGTDLNQADAENDCPKKMFFCGDSNRNAEAVLLLDCPAGKECDQKSFRKFTRFTLFFSPPVPRLILESTVGNACLKGIRCDCPRGLKTGQPYCGSALKGEDCAPNVTFTCPYFGVIFHPSPVDACLHGCQNGLCISENSTAAASAQLQRPIKQ